MSLERSLAEVYNRCGSGKSAHPILLTISSTDGLKRLGGSGWQSRVDGTSASMVSESIEWRTFRNKVMSASNTRLERTRQGVAFIRSCVGEPLKRNDRYLPPRQGAMFIAMKSYNGWHSFRCAMPISLADKRAFIFQDWTNSIDGRVMWHS